MKAHWGGRRRLGNGKLKSQRGVNLVEQALTITFLCSIMFGIIDCARLMYAYHFVSNAAREASRWASVRSQNSPVGHATSGNIQTLVANVPGMGLDATKISTTLNWLPPTNGSPACTGAAGSNKAGCMVQVQVTYNYSFLMPLLPTSGVRMQSTSETVVTQ
jgi:Flp pilus assembly protein TadG